MSKREHWGTEWMSVVIDAEKTVPVAHSPHGDGSFEVGMFTRCGHNWLIQRGGFSAVVMGVLWMPTKHAQKFCRPCRICFVVIP